jgi:hypothetical protein
VKACCEKVEPLQHPDMSGIDNAASRSSPASDGTTSVGSEIKVNSTIVGVKITVFSALTTISTSGIFRFNHKEIGTCITTEARRKAKTLTRESLFL